MPNNAVTKPFCIAKGDSAASNHYWTIADMDVLETIHEEDGPPVTLPNSTTINDNTVGHLPFSSTLTSQGTKTRVLSDLTSANLISLGQLADDGCDIHLDKDSLRVDKHGETILTGTRNKQSTKPP